MIKKFLTVNLYHGGTYDAELENNEVFLNEDFIVSIEITWSQSILTEKVCKIFKDSELQGDPGEPGYSRILLYEITMINGDKYTITRGEMNLHGYLRR